MSSSTASSIPKAGIRDLPDELLLQVIPHLIVEPRFDRSAYGNLISLAAANTRFPGVIRTTFHELKALTVPLPKAFALFRTLRDFPANEWAERVESLEITNYVSPEARKADYGGNEDGCIQKPWSSVRELRRRLRAGLLRYVDARRRSRMPSRQFAIETEVTFRTDCLNVIRDAEDVSNHNKRMWDNALRAGHNNAFLALLLLVLPNLEELLLGGGHMLHYPMLLRDADPWQGPMSPQVDGRRHWTNDPSTQQLREHKYLAQVFEPKYSRLTKLELPSSWSGITLSRAQLISPMYYHFDDLQTLIIPESALPPSHVVLANGLLFSVLPVSLKSLTIVDCMVLTSGFVRRLLNDTVVDPTTYLPGLRSISVYYIGQPFYTLEYTDIISAKALGITIDRFFLDNVKPRTELMASDVGGQPWKLSTDEVFGRAKIPALDRGVCEVAGYWVGSKRRTGLPAGKAKEHFRNRRG
ncbi:hypothetical protein J4E83_009517 [Alternaria metachromatica]|uniref:uncharacterized protein n=1 Tax=Alternaria metachromatica TaxID=283354 RepID=UPI0020C4AE54|nr:uncharacterized protein J4E83_009517 [Alternaria metachromatica]KAI4607620.1 hypothetical protein J4E83_009517 [Alternaria metachromatica]